MELITHDAEVVSAKVTERLGFKSIGGRIAEASTASVGECREVCRDRRGPGAAGLQGGGIRKITDPVVGPRESLERAGTASREY